MDLNRMTIKLQGPDRVVSCHKGGAIKDRCGAPLTSTWTGWKSRRLFPRTGRIVGALRSPGGGAITVSCLKYKAPGQAPTAPRRLPAQPCLGQSRRRTTGFERRLSQRRTCHPRHGQEGCLQKLGLKERLLGALQQIRGSQRVTSQDPEGAYQSLEVWP